jgi:hypothetical protein
LVEDLGDGIDIGGLRIDEAAKDKKSVKQAGTHGAMGDSPAAVRDTIQAVRQFGAPRGKAGLWK